MKKAHELVPSTAMGRPMHLWRYGHWGTPLLAFPTAAGMAHEWEAHGMVEAVAPWIEAGKLKLYCSESNVAETFTRKDRDPSWRAGRYAPFERYVVEELVPHIRADCQSETVPIGAAGASLGALYAANSALKFPHIFRWALCFSGRYDARHFLDGLTDESVYLNSPLLYLPGLEGADLARVASNTHLTLICGQGQWEEGCIEETQALGDLLAAKEIPGGKDIWGRDVSHDWQWWRRQAVFHLGHRLGPA